MEVQWLLLNYVQVCVLKTVDFFVKEYQILIFSPTTGHKTMESEANLPMNLWPKYV